jgi:hypothetical protein
MYNPFDGNFAAVVGRDSVPRAIQVLPDSEGIDFIMGFFANLYVVEGTANKKAVKLRTTVYGSDIGPRAYFCYGPGKRPEGLYPYAGGTVLCDTELKMLTGYPLVETHEGLDKCLVEANFTPRNPDDPVLFHFILPSRFIPRRDMKPLDQPGRPILFSVGDRVIATYPVIGPATIRFWTTRLRKTESIADYELEKLLHPEEERGAKVGFEFNLGFFKVKIG